ncbi:autotransporter outer membrane beta-barrel domain-containing protein [Dyella nitratireducens]|uniref:Lipase/esterase n=1 Tax=Dyella nitratireducens TaxID=1849580 RepID=A0ABQ1GT15_9GAMM|nr:autotransporter domain-containing protein [Dyella nitratireducens]GGA49510.1 lipase/esterase [Dyella nitratireducens]GLQ42169.1 lipase/esterase [Dyella nitratireducens]
MFHPRKIAGAVALALGMVGAVHATGNPNSTFNSVVVFGDSLSDAGNISLATNPSIQPPLKFTTNPGNVTIQNVAAGLGYSLTASLAGGTDYAWGGAGINNNSPGTPSTVPTITSQVTSYLATNSTNPHALYAMWGGANDIFNAATSVAAGATAQQLIAQTLAAEASQAVAAGLIPNNATAIAAFEAQITPTVTAQVNAQVAAAAGVSSLQTATQAQTTIAAAAQQEVKLIGALQAAGAKNIVVFNLPNIGLTPEALEQGASAASSLTTLSVIYNGQLNAGIGQLGKGIIPVNAFALLSQVIANPGAYGFTNVTTPACGVGSSSVECGPQGSGLPYTYAAGTNQTYLFADGVHPTTAADVMLSQVVLSELAAPQQISLLQEAPLAAVTTQTAVVRDQMMADNFGSTTRAFANINYSNQQFDQRAGAPKTTSNNVDLTVGADIHATDYISAGVALGIGEHYADVSGGGGYDLQAITGLGYLTWHTGGAYAGVYGDFGQASYTDVNRVFMIGNDRTHESGKTDGSYVGLGLHGGYWFDVGSLKTGPFANFEYQNIKINGYNENGNDATAMWFGRQERNAVISTLGWRLQGHWQYDSMDLGPYVELGWNHDSRASTDMVTAGLNSMNGSFEMAGFTPDKNWGSVNVGLTAQITPNLSGWIAYNGHFADNSQRSNGVNLGVKYGF